MRLHEQGRFGEAEAVYQDFLDAKPDHPQALRLAGILARQRGEFQKSLERLSRLAEISPRDAVPVSELALTHMMAGDLGRADACFRTALSHDANSYRTIANFGALLQRRGHLHESIGMYRRCIELDPDDLEIHCNLASALVDAGLAKEALDQCDAALSVSPDNPLVLVSRGAVLCGLGDFERAKDVLEQVRCLGIVDEMALINLGFANSRLGDVAAAIEVLLQATAAFPNNARAFADLANAYVADGDIANALECCEIFLKRHPGEPLVLANYAYALGDNGRTEEADSILDFERLVCISDIKNPRGYDNLGRFNDALASYIRQHPSLLENPARKATTGGRQTGELDSTSSPELAVFEALVDDTVDKTVQAYRISGLADHPAMARIADEWSLRIWSTVLQSGGHQTAHLHPAAWLSGVYYVQLPDESGPGGELAFGSPPTHLAVNSPPGDYVVEPRPGRLVVFPSYFYHRTQPFVSDQPRISIAFDVIPRY